MHWRFLCISAGTKQAVCKTTSHHIAQYRRLYNHKFSSYFRLLYAMCNVIKISNAEVNQLKLN